MPKGGAKTWYFPDGFLPEKAEGSSLEAHEALMILNTHVKPAYIQLDFYFEEREPAKNIQIVVGAERCTFFRMDKPEDIGGLEIPAMTQYGLRVRSDVNIVAQFGRLDTTQANLAYYVNVGYHEDE
jgi:hypothetical protein